MIFYLLGIAFLATATFFVDKTARQNGYNAVLWAFITVAALVGIQFLVGLCWGIIFILGSSAQIFSQTSANAVSAVFDIATLALSIGSVVVILNRVNRIKDDETHEVPPPSFNQSN